MTSDQEHTPQVRTDETLMPLEDARRVAWPFDTGEPMGVMFDKRTLTRGKLRWAAEKAQWPDVKRAAQRLLHELDQPTPPATTEQAAPAADPPRYGARVVVASEYLEDQERLHGLLLAYYVGLGVGAFMLTINTILWLLRGQALWLTALSIVANLAAWVWLIVVIRRQVRRARAFRAGRKGEEQVVEQLRTSLDRRWTIYRNLQVPDRRDDLDLVLVGPGGVWAVQVKAFSAPLRFHAGAWEYQRGRHWARCDPKHDPAAQVTRQATALHDYLARNGIDRFVERAIALTVGLPAGNVAASPIPVWLPFNISDQATALATRYAPAGDELQAINILLERRADEQRVVEQAQVRRSRSRSSV